MAGSCAWELRMGQAGKKGSSWRQSSTSSSQTIRTSQKSSSNLNLNFSKLYNFRKSQSFV